MKALVAVVAVLALAAGALACGVGAVVGDVSASFIGQSGSEGATLSWSSDDEGGSPAVTTYKLYRFRCGGLTCGTLIATVPAIGSCGVAQAYSRTDPGYQAGDKYVIETCGSGQCWGAASATP